MLAETGQFALILAFVVALLQGVVPLAGTLNRDRQAMTFASTASLIQFACIAYAYAVLTHAFITSDFSLSVVAANSHTLKPMLYKVSGVWGNHEGSMLLWVLILAVFGASVALGKAQLQATLRANTLAVQGLISAGFLAFILFTSNPFERLPFVPVEGNGLNPILQDPGLAFHPPFLYLGYVGFSIAFSFSVAALIEGKIDASWARCVRPWVLAAWCFLTIGIAIGSFWAYYTLGWGGWWYWDPVENASFMPWLAGTALLHSALVVERRNALLSWTILLGILTFTLSLIGTFLVRSGVLTSVHAFASDPSRGVFILALIVATVGASLILYAWRMPTLKYGAPFSMVSREAGLTLNNAFLTVACATVFIGTFYPLVIDILGDDKISVGPPYYNATFLPIMVPLLVAMAVGPVLKWKRDTVWGALQRLKPAGIAGLLALAVVLMFTLGRSLFAAAAMALAAWVVVGSLLVLVRRSRLGRTSLGESLKLLRSTPAAIVGLVMAHAGLGLSVIGITGISAWSSEVVERVEVGGPAVKIAGYDVGLASINQARGPNYSAQHAEFIVTRNGTPVTKLRSERRFFPEREQLTTVAAIRTTPASNLYVVIGDPDDKGGWTVRIYHHPLVIWIWIGALVMAAGGFVSLSDRRFRIGVATRQPAAARPVAAE
ncbi:MAG: heme lyase CcmF/NrfE family subunit [Hyphomicrobiaceae bacterium]|nr:heme lyase CcmF/NrfE family subunit [Hyphomicrobiaceae bacterium]